MGALWFWIVAVMIVAYVVFDGFDIGVGILTPFLARNEHERRMMLRAIGPVWDGNEVWLLAGGGTLYFAFPLLYASAFSGFYLPLMIVLWLLIGRGISLELRAHIDNHVWRSFFDGVFFVSSALLAIFLGAALANVIRGVPIGPDNYFFLPLWTNWRTGPSPGILDWYTVIGGLVAFIALAMHGALWIALKTTGDLELRAQQSAYRASAALLIVTAVSLPATMGVRPATLDNYRRFPVLFAVPALVVLSLLCVRIFSARGAHLKAFLASAGYLTFMLVGACAGLFPVVLPSSISPAGDITIAKAISGSYAIRVGLLWWIPGMLIALGYVAVTYWIFRGKVPTDSEGYGH